MFGIIRLSLPLFVFYWRIMEEELKNNLMDMINTINNVEILNYLHIIVKDIISEEKGCFFDEQE